MINTLIIIGYIVFGLNIIVIIPIWIYMEIEFHKFEEFHIFLKDFLKDYEK